MTERSPVSIRSLRDEDEAQALAAHEILAAEGFELLLERVPGESWSTYVRKLARNTMGEDLPPGRVPHAFLVAVVDGRIAGRVSVRFELTPYLAEVGGHIGYGVLPEYRGRGIATALLEHGLELLAERGVDVALVTCDADNQASRRVIEKAGGRPDPEKPRAYEGQTTRLRFLVPTAWRSDRVADTREGPAFLAGERESLEQWLEFYRATLPVKIGGLTADQLCARSVPPSTLTIAGIVRHLTFVERYWFANVVAGEQHAPLYCEDDPDGDFNDASPETIADDIGRYDTELAASRLRASRVLDLDAPLPGLRHGERLNLRWVYVHMIEEYARHMGRVDLLREAIDGVTGE